MPMIVMTTSNSTNVKALFGDAVFIFAPKRCSREKITAEDAKNAEKRRYLLVRALRSPHPPRFSFFVLFSLLPCVGQQTEESANSQNKRGWLWHGRKGDLCRASH